MYVFRTEHKIDIKIIFVIITSSLKNGCLTKVKLFANFKSKTGNIFFNIYFNKTHEHQYKLFNKLRSCFMSLNQLISFNNSTFEELKIIHWFSINLLTGMQKHTK